ncbi:hypothetical protein A2U01_0102322, partial [Trifolium medium]|nr:hypothetical protein [Trifolium medium]
GVFPTRYVNSNVTTLLDGGSQSSLWVVLNLRFPAVSSAPVASMVVVSFSCSAVF